MSGYEKSPDYGGPEPHRYTLIIGLLIFVAFCAIVTYGGLLAIIRSLVFA